MTKRTTAAVWVKGIADLLAAEGLDVASLFAAAGIERSSLEGPGARVATEKISHLWELAVERSRNPALALAQHHVARPASFDVVGYTMMSCADLRSAFDGQGVGHNSDVAAASPPARRRPGRPGGARRPGQRCATR